jgi:hypothetical protein
MAISTGIRGGKDREFDTTNFDDSEQVTRDGPKPGEHGTWGADDLENADIHHGETGLNRLAAQRVKDAKKRDPAKQPISRPAPEPTVDNSALVPVEGEGLHYGNAGLNRLAAERHAGK